MLIRSLKIQQFDESSLTKKDLMIKPGGKAAWEEQDPSGPGEAGLSPAHL